MVGGMVTGEGGMYGVKVGPATGIGVGQTQGSELGIGVVVIQLHGAGLGGAIGVAELSAAPSHQCPAH